LTQTQLEIVNKLVANNPIQYNLLKACEELTELTEVLLKKVNKKGGIKEPPNSAIIEEIGDSYIRLAALSIIFGEEAVEARINYKLGNFEKYMKEGKYRGTI